MDSGLGIPNNVSNLQPADGEGVRDQVAVTPPRDRLGAHDGHRRINGQGDQAVERLPEGRLLHVVGITAEGAVVPTRVWRVDSRLPKAAEFREMNVTNALRGECSLEVEAVEMGHVARPWYRPHIGQQLYVVLVEQRHKLLQRASGMPDRKNGRRS